MKNKIFIGISVIAIAILALASQVFAAENWSKYESGTDNIRLDGYQGQPGYLAFTDGNGSIVGYVWLDRERGLVWCSPEALTHSTTKLTNDYGTAVATPYLHYGSN
jgi:hypothetical protein